MILDEERSMTVPEEPAATEEVSEQEITEESSAATKNRPAEKPEASEKAKEIAGSPEEEPVEESTELDRILDEEPESEDNSSKTGVQRRIDTLVGEKKALEARLAALEADKATREGKTPEYSDAQLRVALKKALDEQDSDLVWEIMDYRLKRQQESLVKMYQDEKKQSLDNAQRIQSEWEETCSAYDKYADTKIPAVYSSSHKDLNLRDASSLLYQVAMQLYWNGGSVRERYKGPGGQKLAVADALTKIISYKGAKGKDSEKEKLKRQLQKEKRKQAIVGEGSPGAEEKSSGKPKTDAERLAEVIAERKKYQEERGN